MRSALYRSAWLLIVCVLVLTLSVPGMPMTAALADSNDHVTSLSTSHTSCTTSEQRGNDQFDRYSLFVNLAPVGACRQYPSTVLIARDRPAQADAAGAHAVSTMSALDFISLR